ncbi:TIR domain-containing protein [Treponema socranskii]|uniref:TIR domain-containing protein n=1 Tax=Treponema socranskii TaxID=53419 RepID=UPI003D9170FE
MAKIFISYCHDDEKFMTEYLIPLFNTLQQENKIEFFYDRKLRSGEELFKTIDFHMRDSDIAILLLSKSFYNSENCKKEKNAFLKRKQLDGIYMLSLIISECDWHNDISISKDLLLNTDGKNLVSLSKEQLENELQKVKERLISINNDIEILKQLKTIKIQEFNNFLEDTDIFKTSHRSKNTLLLSDIFIYPQLRKYRIDEDKDEDIDSENIFTESKEYKYIFIHGDDQSGKTALLKKIIQSSLEKYFITFYFLPEENFDGHIFNILVRKFKQMFEIKLSDEKIKRFLMENKEKIILFFDDFHKINNKKKIIEKISIFSKIICTVDLIYNLDVEINAIRDQIIKFAIKEFSPKKRDALIKRWLYLDEDIKTAEDPEKVKQIDKKAEQIEIITGKSLNGGIMPAYPFLILSILSNVETLNRPLSQQITSYGYCYEALIIIAFTKIGLKTDDEIAGCINFLSHFAYKLFKKEAYESNAYDFESFLADYEEKIALPFKKEIFIKKLEKSRLLIKTSLGTYRFDYKYIYYYFVAKYLSNNNNIAIEIKHLCANIHKDENAYIVIFYSHNNKSDEFYKILLDEANNVFTTNAIVSLNKDDTKFFDTSYKAVLNVALPNKNHNYKAERDKRLEVKSEKEYSESHENSLDDSTDDYSKNLRKSIKLVEAIGLIAKNRCTSIEKSKVKELLLTAINLNLRGLDSFFCLFKTPDVQTEFINFFAEAIKKEILREQETDYEKCKKIAHNFFWGMNFLYVYIIIQKTIHSIGSERIIPFMEDIANNDLTAANELILEGIKIIYGKNIDKTHLFRYIKNKNTSELAKTILRIFVVDFCKMHPIKHYSDIQQLSDKMQINIEKIKKR